MMYLHVKEVTWKQRESASKSVCRSAGHGWLQAHDWAHTQTMHLQGTKGAGNSVKTERRQMFKSQTSGSTCQCTKGHVELVAPCTPKPRGSPPQTEPLPDSLDGGVEDHDERGRQASPEASQARLSVQLGRHLGKEGQRACRQGWAIHHLVLR